ncbi:MAG: hypothetical protein WC803_12850 [Sphingomonas sp.]|jgi:hypothetical protein
MNGTEHNCECHSKKPLKKTWDNLQKGDVLVSRGGFEHLVIEVFGDIVYGENTDIKDEISFIWTKQMLQYKGYTIKQPEKHEEIKDYDSEVGDETLQKSSIKQPEVSEDWTPKEQYEYWFIRTSGSISMWIWHNSETDNEIKNFLGIFRTEKEAQKRLEEVKLLLKK